MESVRPTQNESNDRVPPQVILHEQRTADNSAAFLLPKLETLSQANPDLKILDVGCGPGTISISFAKLVPGGYVTGVDLNDKLLPRAQAAAEAAGVQNIAFQPGSIYDLPFADCTFDVTFCHQVLVHIGKPWDAMREMLRVTKRGGVVAAREGDYETECVWPADPQTSRFHELMASLMRAGGGDPTTGRQLVSWAIRAGAHQDQIELSYSATSYTTAAQRHITAQGLSGALRGGSIRDKALKLGLGTAEEFEDMAQAWEKWSTTQDASLGMLNGEILIEK